MAKENKDYCKKTIKDIEAFLGYIEDYWDKTHEDSFSRYMSWEHCYEHFQESYSKLIVNKFIGSQEKNSLTLWLAWYLASWGMYRGSSALLNHSYEIHRSVIELLLNKRWRCLNNLKCENWSDETWKTLEDLREKICVCYGKKISVTDTLFTKILLGTFGCTPAFDNLFKNSLSINSINKGLFKKHIRNFNLSTMKELCEFCNEFSKKSKRRLKKMKTMTKKLPYPQMKILDMGFWNFWNKKTKSKKEA